MHIVVNVIMSFTTSLCFLLNRGVPGGGAPPVSSSHSGRFCYGRWGGAGGGDVRIKCNKSDVLTMIHRKKLKIVND